MRGHDGGVRTVDAIHKPAGNRLIGSPIERVEDWRFLRGRGEFVDDVKRGVALHAAILRSSVAHGRIRSIDPSAALKQPGVHAVITATDIGAIPIITMRQELLPEYAHFQQPVIAHEKVRYVGEPIAVVVADSAALAEDALDAIALDIEALPAVASRAASRAGASLLYEARGSNLVGTLTALRGDADAAFKDAAYVRRERFEVQRFTAVPMEPRGLLAEWDAAKGHLTVFGAAKVAFHNRAILAKQMGLAEDAITMIESDVGGGFGVRGEFYPEDFLIPFAARKLGRPVKWIEDRREHLLATNHARDAECELEIACDRDGTIRGLRGRGAVDLGAYIRTNGITAARNIAQVLSGPYRVPHIHFDVDLLLTNKTPSGTYRGPGRFEADFFRERLFDIAARRARHRPGGIPPPQSDRRKPRCLGNSPTVMPLDIGTETDNGDYQATLDRCLAEFGWTEKSKLQGQRIDGRLSRHRGRLLSRRRRLRTARERAAGDRGGWCSLGLCRLVGARPGHRDDLRADRRRRAGSSDEPHQRRDARLDHACVARLWLLQLALDGDGRLGHSERRGEAERSDSRSCGQATRLRAAGHFNHQRGDRRPRRQIHAVECAGGRVRGRHLRQQQAHV